METNPETGVARSLSDSLHAPSLARLQHAAQGSTNWASTVDDEANVNKFLRNIGFNKSLPAESSTADTSAPLSGPPVIGPRSSSINSSPTMTTPNNTNPAGALVIGGGLTTSIHARKENELPVDKLAQTLRSSSLGNTTPPQASTPASALQSPNLSVERVAVQAQQESTLPRPSTAVTGSVPKLEQLKVNPADLADDLEVLQELRATKEQELQGAQELLSNLRVVCDADVKSISVRYGKHQANIAIFEKQRVDLEKKQSVTKGYLVVAQQDKSKAEEDIRKATATLRAAEQHALTYQNELSEANRTLEQVHVNLASERANVEKLGKEMTEKNGNSAKLAQTTKVVAEIRDYNLRLFEDKIKQLKRVAASNSTPVHKGDSQVGNTTSATVGPPKTWDKSSLLSSVGVQEAIGKRSNVKSYKMENGNPGAVTNGSKANESQKQAVVNPTSSISTGTRQYQSVEDSDEDVELELVDEVQDIPRKWPAPQPRPAGSKKHWIVSSYLTNLTANGYLASVIRAVILSNLPASTEYKHIFCLVFNGTVQEVRWGAARQKAFVMFLTHDACMKYYKATSNGIPFPGQPERIITVELHKEVSPVTEVVRGYIENGMTRCVKATYAGPNKDKQEDWKSDALNNIGKGCDSKGEKLKDVSQIRILDGVLRGMKHGNHVYVWRFSSIVEASHLFRWLKDEWDEFNIRYDTDPCTDAEGVHLRGASDLMQAARVAGQKYD